MPIEPAPIIGSDFILHFTMKFNHAFKNPRDFKKHKCNLGCSTIRKQVYKMMCGRNSANTSVEAGKADDKKQAAAAKNVVTVKT